ncbi:hypothetical protein PROFUN_01798 [Planoprotostelium fungivorum]|uniref:UDENN domain-containing protein n=1 Tax=Planoprotostelium fungivorum TaxID=1890364 RepID=A0A2P6NYS9_9EUKA|nr:hypothetical protein PROFUN_01798 [Planoprotostelium fungivorum]
MSHRLSEAGVGGTGGDSNRLSPFAPPSHRGHRRQTSIGTAMQPIREGNLFEYFAVVGLPSQKEGEEPAKEPAILYQYPPESTKKMPFDIVPFCIPTSTETRRIARSGSLSELHNILYGQLSVLEKSQNSFLFLLVHEKDIFWGICVINKEVHERNLSFSGKLTSSGNNIETRPAQESNDKTRTASITTRVYCLVSRFAFFKLHYSIIYSILARERLAIIEDSNRWMMNGGTAESEDYSDLSNASKDILSILKTAGASLTFKIPGELHSLAFKAPEGNEDRLVGEWTLPLTFKALRLESILQIINAALVETRIIIVCPNMGVLSSLVLSLIPLLRPYAWQGPCIPIVPAKLSECLQAPVPFLVGVVSLKTSLESELDALVIRLDHPQKEIINLPKSAIPMLPRRDKLYPFFVYNPPNLNKAGPMKEFPDSYKSTPEDLDLALKIMLETQKFHQEILSLIIPFVSRGCLDSTSEIDKLINHMGQKKFKDFFSAFFVTQHFSEYLDDYFLKLTEAESHATQMREHFGTLIKGYEQEKESTLSKIEALHIKLKEIEFNITDLKEKQAGFQTKTAILPGMNSPNMSAASTTKPGTPKRNIINAGMDALTRAFQN